uniref:Peptidase inhibitor 3 n=2 Tax=Felis catus TaxID=9685 RepID=A0ABI7Y5Y4_FELCA
RSRTRAPPRRSRRTGAAPAPRTPRPAGGPAACPGSGPARVRSAAASRRPRSRAAPRRSAARARGRRAPGTRSPWPVDTGRAGCGAGVVSGPAFQKAGFNPPAPSTSSGVQTARRSGASSSVKREQRLSFRSVMRSNARCRSSMNNSSCLSSPGISGQGTDKGRVLVKGQDPVRGQDPVKTKDLLKVPVSTKPGSCPNILMRCAMMNPPNHCLRDTECPGAKKCCHGPCGLACLDPQ